MVLRPYATSAGTRGFVEIRGGQVIGFYAEGVMERRFLDSEKK